MDQFYRSPYGYPQQPITPVQNRQSGIIWVQGEEGARAYAIPPNSSISLFDSENEGIFYIKVSDSIGMYNLRTFNYKEVINLEPVQQGTNYATKEDLKEIKDLIMSMRGGKNEQPLQPTQRPKQPVSDSSKF